MNAYSSIMMPHNCSFDALIFWTGWFKTSIHWRISSSAFSGLDCCLISAMLLSCDSLRRMLRYSTDLITQIHASHSLAERRTACAAQQRNEKQHFTKLGIKENGLRTVNIRLSIQKTDTYASVIWTEFDINYVQLICFSDHSKQQLHFYEDLFWTVKKLKDFNGTWQRSSQFTVNGNR